MSTEEISIQECPFCGEENCIHLGRYGYRALMEEYAAQGGLPDQDEDVPAAHRRP